MRHSTPAIGGVRGPRTSRCVSPFMLWKPCHDRGWCKCNLSGAHGVKQPHGGEQKQLAPGRRHETWAPGGMFTLQLFCIEARLEMVMQRVVAAGS